jgi:hypothetical protein
MCWRGFSCKKQSFILKSDNFGINKKLGIAQKFKNSLKELVSSKRGNI